MWRKTLADYVTLEEAKYTAGLTGLNYKDDDLREAITAASRSIDNYCGRTFYSGGTADVRYYTAYDSTTHLNIDDVVSVTALETDYDGDGVYETLWTQGTDFLLEPQNAPTLSQPYTSIRVLYPRTSLRLPKYAGAIRITGSFGWDSPPPEVKRATRILAIRLMKRGDAPFGVVGVGFDNTSVRIPSVDPDLRFLLDPYAKGGGVMVA